MALQHALPFDEHYAWLNFIRQLTKLPMSGCVSYYGLKNRKVKLTKVRRDLFLVESYSLNALKGNAEYDKGVRFFEVEFMSSVLKDSKPHLHVYERLPEKKEEWIKQTYRCINPICKHYTQAQYIVGKMAECVKCHDSYYISKGQVQKQNRTLTCVACSKSPKAEKIKKAKESILGILETIEAEKVEAAETQESLFNATKESE